MKKSMAILLALSLASGTIQAQSAGFERIKNLLGEWGGFGIGPGNDTSFVESSFRTVMNGKYIEVIHKTWISSTLDKPEGELMEERGFIGAYNGHGIVYRQFSNAGTFIEYRLSADLSTDSLLVFESHSTENFDPGSKTRLAILQTHDNEIVTTLYLASSGNEFVVRETNRLKKRTAVSETEANPHEARVTGIGGIFFKADDPPAVRIWYGENLGLALSDYGSVFEFRNANRPEEINYLQWGPFKSTTTYFEPSQKEFMLNYRVQHLEELLLKLRACGVTIVDAVEEYPYGKFVHILDPFGNKIELWEPVDHVLTEIGGPTTK